MITSILNQIFFFVFHIYKMWEVFVEMFLIAYYSQKTMVIIQL